MLIPQPNKFSVRFSCLVDCAELAFLWQNNQFGKCFELDLIVFGMEAFVHADAAKRSKALLCFFHDRHCDHVVGDVLHHLVMQDESVLILDHANAQAKFDGHTRLSFGDPFRVGLEQREDLLSVRNALTLQHASLNLLELPRCVHHELVKFSEEDLGQHEVREKPASLVRSIKIVLGRKAKIPIQIIGLHLKFMHEELKLCESI